MRTAEAQLAVAKLVAAFPREWVGEATNAGYVEALSELRSAQALVDAVNCLIRSEERLPSIAAVRLEYRRHAERRRLRTPSEPELTDEQRVENLLRVRRLLDQLRFGNGEAAT